MCEQKTEAELRKQIWLKKSQNYDFLEALRFLTRKWASLVGATDDLSVVQIFDPATQSINKKNAARANSLGQFVRNETFWPIKPGLLPGIHEFIVENDPFTHEGANSTADKNRLAQWERAKEHSKRIADIFRLNEDLKNGVFSMDRIGEYIPTHHARSDSLSELAELFDLKRSHFEDDFTRFLPEGADDMFVSFACFRLSTTAPNSIVRTRLILQRPSDNVPYTRFWNLANNKSNDPRDAMGIALPLNGYSHLSGKLQLPHNQGLERKALVLGNMRDVNKDQTRVSCRGLIISRNLANSLSIAGRVFCIREKGIDLTPNADGEPECSRDHLKLWPIEDARRTANPYPWRQNLVDHLEHDEKLPERDKTQITARNIIEEIRGYPTQEFETILRENGLSDDVIEQLHELLSTTISIRT